MQLDPVSTPLNFTDCNLNLSLNLVASVGNTLAEILSHSLVRDEANSPPHRNLPPAVNIDRASTLAWTRDRDDDKMAIA